MPFDLDPVTLIYIFAAISTILLVEAFYLMFFTTASYKTTVNRRMRMIQTEPNRENILVQLRRERSLTAGGGYALPLESFNRLVMQSGLSMGVGKFLMIVAAVIAIGFMFLVWYGFTLAYAAGIALV